MTETATKIRKPQTGIAPAESDAEAISLGPIPDTSPEAMAPLRHAIKTATKTGGPRAPPPNDDEESTITDEQYRAILLEEAPDPCIICGKKVLPSKEAVTRFPCDCNQSYQYHSKCVKKTAFGSDILNEHGCIHCFVADVERATAAGKRAADRKIRTTLSLPEVTVALMSEFLSAIEEPGYEKGYFHRITQFVKTVDEQAVKRDFTLAVQDSYIMQKLKERSIDYDTLFERGFDLPKILALCQSIEEKGVFLLWTLRISKVEHKDFIRYAPLVFECKVTPKNLRITGFTLDALISMKPTATELISCGFHAGELLVMGFKKQHFGSFTSVSITEYVSILGFTYDIFVFMEITASDFTSKGVFSNINKNIFARALNIEIESIEAVKIGLCTFSAEKPSRLNKDGVPYLD